MTKKTMVPTKQDAPRTTLARRDFLIKSGAVIGTAAFALGDSALVNAETTNIAPLDPNLPLEVPQWTRNLGTPTASPYGKPSTFEAKVVRNLYPGLKDTMSAYSTSPLQELDGIITPNGLFYERHHAGVPQINPAEHRLVIHGSHRNSLDLYRGRDTPIPRSLTGALYGVFGKSIVPSTLG